MLEFNALTGVTNSIGLQSIPLTTQTLPSAHGQGRVVPNLRNGPRQRSAPPLLFRGRLQTEEHADLHADVPAPGGDTGSVTRLLQPARVLNRAWPAGRTRPSTNS